MDSSPWLAGGRLTGGTGKVMRIVVVKGLCDEREILDK
jgi:hypothetical protein